MLRALRVLSFAFGVIMLVAVAQISQSLAESFLVSDENQMHNLVNQTRTAKGLGSLAGNDALRTIARRQAQAMAVAGYIYHTPDLAAQAQAASIPWLILGENVGVGPTMDAVQQAFLASPHHYENIVEPRFNALGVGATAGTEGRLFFSQDFAGLKAAAQPVAAVRTAAPAGTTNAGRTATQTRPATTPVVAAATPVPTPVVTPVPTPAVDPEALARSLDRFPAGAGQAEAVYARDAGSPVNPDSAGRPPLGQGLLAMVMRFFAKLAFWR